MQDREDYQSEAGIVADLARLAIDPTKRLIPTSAGTAILLVEEGGGGERLRLVEDLVREGLAGRIVQSLTVETEDSLIAYTQRAASKSAALFASISSNAILAVMDYHAPHDEWSGPGVELGTDAYGSHTAQLRLRHSLEWDAWKKFDGSMQSQLNFVRFLEENREDIAAPDAATVIEACRDLQALRKVDFRSAVREDSNNVRIEYVNEADTRSSRGDLTLPAEFTIRIPVYFGGPEIEIFALLRWEVSDDGVLTLGLKLKRLERIKQAEFQRIVYDISEATGVPAFYGALNETSDRPGTSRGY